MPRILSQALIKQYTKDRAELEVGLSKELYGIYNRDPIRGKIQDTIAFAFENVLGHVILPARTAPAIQEALKEGKLLQVFVKRAGGPPSDAKSLGEKCMKIMGDWRKWDAADCSDLARFMGSVLEKAAVGPEWKDFDGTHTKYKPDNYYKNIPDQPGRSRTFDPKYGSQPGIHTKIGRDAGLELRFKAYDDSGKELGSGITPFRLMPWSTVRRIDIAFGLPEGADISGTTSDAIIMNQLVARFCAAIKTTSTSTSKLLQLLPLVTLVSHGHHTLVESALTLTLYGFCRYRIGFYTSLVASGTKDTKKYDVGGEVLRVLQKAEDDKRNRHILCWWDHGLRQYTGEQYESPEEIRNYRSFAVASEDFLKYFRHRVHDQVYLSDLEGLKSGAYADVKRVRI